MANMGYSLYIYEKTKLNKNNYINLISQAKVKGVKIIKYKKN